MDDNEFKQEVTKLLYSFNKLKDEALKKPNYDKVNQLVTIASIVANEVCRPQFVPHDNTLNRAELLKSKQLIGAQIDDANTESSEAEIDTYWKVCEILDSGEDRAGFNQILKDLASRSRTWLIPLSVTKGVDYQFPRSKENDSPLEKLLEELTLSKNLLSESTVSDDRKGTKFIENGKLSTTGYVHQQLESIRNYVDRSYRDEIDTHSLTPPFTWIEEALKLEPLSEDSIEHWLDVIISKLDEESGEMLSKFNINEIKDEKSFIADPRQYFQGSTAPYIVWGHEYYAHYESNGGGVFKTFIRKKMRRILKKIISFPI